MPYLELPPSGRADDLLGILVRAEETRYARTGVVMPEKPALTRAWLEPLGNLIGRALHLAFLFIPNSVIAKIQQEGWKKLAAPDIFPFDPAHPGLAGARKLSESLSAAGRPPALLCLFTHPPVTGEWLHLNIELTRHALWALGHLRAKLGRPCLIVAVDPFAIDGFGLLLEGAYAGFMGSLHLGFDRLASHRGALSRALVGGTAWSRIAHRLSARLNARGEVGIPLGGGVPTTSRALYSAKEFVWGLRRSPGRRTPAQALLALETDPAFKAFASGGLVGVALRKNVWRMMEAWLMALVSGAWGGDGAREGGPSADLGKLTPAAREAALGCVRAMGLADGDARLAALDGELGRETPYRARLFRILARRVAGRGVPLVLIPLSHGRPPDVKMEWGEAVALVGARGDTVDVMDVDGSRRTQPLADFARAFVDKNLP